LNCAAHCIRKGFDQIVCAEEQRRDAANPPNDREKSGEKLGHVAIAQNQKAAPQQAECSCQRDGSDRDLAIRHAFTWHGRITLRLNPRRTSHHGSPLNPSRRL
jgi:hypothetical protein